MARERSEQSRGAHGEGDDADAKVESEDDASEPSGAIPEMIRRAMAAGLSGFFMTEGALRRALGDTLPREWVDFAAAQSERTRSELIDRLGEEFGQVLHKIDIERLFEELLSGRTLEIDARIRFADRDEKQGREEPPSREARGQFALSTPEKKKDE